LRKSQNFAWLLWNLSYFFFVHFIHYFFLHSIHYSCISLHMPLRPWSPSSRTGRQVNKFRIWGIHTCFFFLFMFFHCYVSFYLCPFIVMFLSIYVLSLSCFFLVLVIIFIPLFLSYLIFSYMYYKVFCLFYFHHIFDNIRY
jgi:hypothetical protein